MDECWFCGKILNTGDLFVDIKLRQFNKLGQSVTASKPVPKGGCAQDLYDRMCLECAIVHKVFGIHAENLDACAPKKWRKQVSTSAINISER